MVLKTLILDLMYYFREHRIRKIKISSTKKDCEKDLVRFKTKKERMIIGDAIISETSKKPNKRNKRFIG